MSKISEIIHLGNPLLREVAKPIQKIEDPSLQNLIQELISTTIDHNGVGIAAPQVAQSLQLIIVASHPTPRYPQAPQMEPIAMINPRIVNHSGEPEKGWEGCLSVPGIRGLVPRYPQIVIEYTDIHNQVCCQELTGFVARIFQHEYDHLQGIVFLDRVESTQEMITEQEYQKLFTE
ncbi:MAG: peptide deformylase [Coleofasciculaceae cyanobacterium SM2_1_6]|nr:peptide deformylase [Coleofasciculaceae cyanobacterium SM2_1_6]